MELPKAKTPIEHHLDKLLMVLYGVRKVGKTTLASTFPKAIFAATEPGHRFAQVFKNDINSWEDFLEFGALLLNEEHDFKTCVVDTIDNLFKFCEVYVCKKWDIDHPTDLIYGKGWSLLNSEFNRAILRLTSSKMGFIFISHQVEREVKTRVSTYTKITSTMGAGAKNILEGMVDIIAQMSTEMIKDDQGNIIEDRKVLITSGDPTLDVGTRGSPKMRFPKRIILPLDESEDYEAICEAIRKENL